MKMAQDFQVDSELVPPAARSEAARLASSYLDAMLEAPEAFRGPQVRGGGAVAEFERLLARRCGFPHCVAVASATSGLLALVAAAELRGRKVLVPDGFWPGTPGALRFVGVEVVEVPTVDPGLPDPDAVRSLLASGGFAAAIIGEERGGSERSTELGRICGAAGCLVIEDSSRLPGVSVSPGSRSPADIQVMSFGPGKPLALGEGGALLTRSREIYDRVVASSQHPERCFAEGIECDPARLALNARIHPLAAVLGVALLSES